MTGKQQHDTVASVAYRITTITIELRAMIYFLAIRLDQIKLDSISLGKMRTFPNSE